LTVRVLTALLAPSLRNQRYATVVLPRTFSFTFAEKVIVAGHRPSYRCGDTLGVLTDTTRLAGAVLAAAGVANRPDAIAVSAAAPTAASRVKPAEIIGGELHSERHSMDREGLFSGENRLDNHFGLNTALMEAPRQSSNLPHGIVGIT